MDQAGSHLKIAVFLGQMEFQTMSTLIPNTLPKPQSFANEVLVVHSNSSNSACDDASETVGNSSRGIYMSSCPLYTQHIRLKIPWALSKLLLHNIAGPEELSTLAGPWLHMKRGRGTRRNYLPHCRLCTYRACSIFIEIQMRLQPLD